MSSQIGLLLLLFCVPLLSQAKAPKPAKSAKPAKTEITVEVRLEQACVKQAKDAAKSSAKETCACVTRNMKEKLDPKELLLITRTYEGDAKAEVELERKEYAALQTFDVEVAEQCLENPAFNVTK